MAPQSPLEGLYDNHAAALFRFLIGLIGNEAEVKDVLQEVFIRLAKDPNILRGVRSPRAYLCQMAYRMAIDQIRRRTTRQKCDDRVSRETTGEVLPPESEMDLNWQKQIVEQSLASLPHEQRAVVLLKVWEDLTFAEIGTTLSISPETAASRYRYGLNKLRAALRPLHGDLR